MASLVTVDEMLSALPKSEHVIVNRLRDLVSDCLPKASERGYYGLGVPFYRHHRLICFIWPASVIWGRSDHAQTRTGVTLGFCQGNRMSNEDGRLLSEGRKQVYVMYFNHVTEIDEGVVRSLLFEAAMIDDSFAKNSRKGRRSVDDR